MIGSNTKNLFIANTVKKKYNSRALLSLTLEPIQKGDSPATNKNVVLTHGLYYMRYEPVRGGTNYIDKPFLIKSDLFTMDKIRVANYNVLVSIAKENKKVDFILKFSNISPELFAITKSNPGLEVPIAIDYAKYRTAVMEKHPEASYKQIFREVLEDDD